MTAGGGEEHDDGGILSLARERERRPPAAAPPWSSLNASSTICFLRSQIYTGALAGVPAFAARGGPAMRFTAPLLRAATGDRRARGRRKQARTKEMRCQCQSIQVYRACAEFGALFAAAEARRAPTRARASKRCKQKSAARATAVVRASRTQMHGCAVRIFKSARALIGAGRN